MACASWNNIFDMWSVQKSLVFQAHPQKWPCKRSSERELPKISCTHTNTFACCITNSQEECLHYKSTFFSQVVDAPLLTTSRSAELAVGSISFFFLPLQPDWKHLSELTVNIFSLCIIIWLELGNCSGFQIDAGPGIVRNFTPTPAIS